MNRLMGGLLIAIGILMTGASGLCSAWVGFGMLAGPGDDQSRGLMIGLVLVFGGTPFIGGIAMALAGRHILRRDRAVDHNSVF
jgi:hypothetical protein